MSTSIELFEIQRWMKDAACKGNTVDYAMARPDLQGVWGGLSARKRGSLRAKGYNND